MTPADFYVVEDRVVAMPPEEAARAAARPATDAEIAERARQSIRKQPRDGSSCCGSRGRRGRIDVRPVPTVCWLGLDWIGVPWPRRLRPQWPVRVQASPGCGCLLRLKTWLERRRSPTAG